MFVLPYSVISARIRYLKVRGIAPTGNETAKNAIVIVGIISPIHLPKSHLSFPQIASPIPSQILPYILVLRHQRGILLSFRSPQIPHAFPFVPGKIRNKEQVWSIPCFRFWWSHAGVFVRYCFPTAPIPPFSHPVRRSLNHSVISTPSELCKTTYIEIREKAKVSIIRDSQQKFIATYTVIPYLATYCVMMLHSGFSITLKALASFLA